MVFMDIESELKRETCSTHTSVLFENQSREYDGMTKLP